MRVQEERYADLERPAVGCVWQIPFVVVAYIPTIDGEMVDFERTGFRGTVQQLRDRILRAVRVTKWMMEEATRFRGYKEPGARSSLGYRCARFVTILEDIPKGRSAGSAGVFFPDYGKIVEQVGGKNLVNQQGAKEFWIYHWHHGSIAPIETNLSSALSGDISNSDRQNDLPIYDKSYMVVGANFNRGPDKHVHNIGHQMEALLSYVNQRQDSNTDLFNKQFCGQDDKGKFQQGRCGNCHFPPNATKDYDYFNPKSVPSDIEDWNPQGTGVKKLTTYRTWERLPYRCPTGDKIRQPGTILEDDAWWYLYWFQNFPGHESHIAHPKGEMTNWWRFLGDWDGAFKEKYGLWKIK
jgi:hypothetical protein